MYHEHNGARAGTDGRTVMLLYSDDDVRSLTRILLAKRGYSVLEARDPEAALDVANRRASSVDLLIAQVTATGAHGPDFAQHMRSFYPRLKVLFVAERPCHPDVRRVLRRSETELIGRPYTLNDMANRVGALMAMAP